MTSSHIHSFFGKSSIYYCARRRVHACTGILQECTSDRTHFIPDRRQILLAVESKALAAPVQACASYLFGFFDPSLPSFNSVQDMAFQKLQNVNSSCFSFSSREDSVRGQNRIICAVTGRFLEAWIHNSFISTMIWKFLSINRLLDAFFLSLSVMLVMNAWLIMCNRQAEVRHDRLFATSNSRSFIHLPQHRR